MYYLVYRITNLLNGKVYTGAHQTTDKNDGYMGSGKYLKRSINKYGIDNFRKDILCECNTAKEMYDKERNLVFIGPGSYNLKPGGKGGWDHQNLDSKIQSRKGIKANKRMAELRKTDPAWEERRIQKCVASRAEWIKNNPEKAAAPLHNWNTKVWKGQKHTVETRKKIGLANKKNIGNKNSQFGTMWITNELESKKVKKSFSIPKGWRKGRIML